MNFKKYLPSAKFSKFLGIALAIGIFLFFIFKFVSIKTSARQNIQNIATREIVEQLDTDSDGLKDWEEALWGMDYQNPDSDNNGILDGQEAEKLKLKLKESDQYIEVEEIPDTETEKIARQLLTVALNFNQTSGGQISPEEVNILAEGFLQSVKATNISFYSMSDIKISSTKTAQSYYDEMSKKFEYFDSIPKNELSILEHAMSTKREKILDGLTPIIDIYTKTAEKALDNEVPTQVAVHHLEYINALTQKAIALVSMAQFFKDPILAVRGVEEYKIADQRMIEASDGINKFLTSNRVIR